jgi:hypothetical protein
MLEACIGSEIKRENYIFLDALFSQRSSSRNTRGFERVFIIKLSINLKTFKSL